MNASVKSNLNHQKTHTIETVIIGAGFGGLGMAIRLLQEGRKDFVILEKASNVGGTWRENTYPGAACDVQSHMYSFSFAPKTDWSKRYAERPEIYNYIQETTEKFGLRPYIRFNVDVTGAAFDEPTARWTLNLKDGSSIVAKFVILASGPLHVPQIPDYKGMDKFKGKIFHSAQWDHDYDLTGKKVASIGTGGSAIQYIPEIAPIVEQLDVYQRTPAWVIPRDERKYGMLDKKLFEKLPLARKLHRARLYWSNESRVAPIFHPKVMATAQKGIELFIRYQIKDKELAKKLTPNYVMGCKRILISNKYYPAFTRKNVNLILDSIQEFTETGIITKDGKHREADCVILGTGFIVDPRIYMKDFPCTGLDGRNLMDDWKDGAEAYYGVSVNGYPNLFQLVGPNTALGHNSIIFMIEAQANYILDAIKNVERKGADYLDVKSEVQAEFNEKIQEKLVGTVWQNGGCVSWYQQADGKNFTIWPGYTWRYWLETRKIKPGAYNFVKVKAVQAA
ncbi:flavin-containing monooxygenase [Alkanindiges sp. WGS2144]|uniref:flavin-containing monooxygenase n=1 Tax=Alkanindiges sp. WGS2144 TaxID=3366808 RepID=UPI0037532386